MMNGKLRLYFNNWKYFVVFTFTLLCCGCGYYFFSGYQPVKFQGTSMLPAIKDNETIYLNRNFSELKRGDIIAFRFPKDTSKSYVKRIIGLPNETVEIRESKVYINGSLLPEPYVAPENNSVTLNSPAVKIPENSYYVMGDSRDNSSDSRSWGFVPRELIYGVVVNKTE